MFFFVFWFVYSSICLVENCVDCNIIAKLSELDYALLTQGIFDTFI